MSGLILAPGAGASTGLTYIEKDKQWQRTNVVGRYDCEMDEWISPTHRKSVILRAWESMVEVQEKMNSSWTGDTPKVEGPLQHIEFSTDTTTDAGPGANRPDPRDQEANDRYEAAERSKAARKSGMSTHIVDFTLTAPFKRRVTGAFRVHIPESR